MKTSRLGTGRRLATRSRPRLSATMIFPMAIALFAGTVAVCSPSSASSPSTPTNAGVLKMYMQESGTGNRLLPSVTLPSKWTVTWKFDCQNLSKKVGTFILSSTEQGRSSARLTDQTGLGGGGQRPFTVSGKYSFAITTTCGWKLTAGTTPPPPPNRPAK